MCLIWQQYLNVVGGPGGRYVLSVMFEHETVIFNLTSSNQINALKYNGNITLWNAVK